MSANKKPKKPRNGIAWSMIVNRTGLGKTFQDKRRSKDYKHSWKREVE